MSAGELAIDRLIRRIEETGSPVVLGLDTRVEQMPHSWREERIARGGATGAILDYNTAILDAVAGVVPCVKIQSACYELYGTAGSECLARTIAAARERGCVVILDAKRGDIGSTAEAYAAAYLSRSAELRADFLTVNPYFGTDGTKPFVDACRESGAGIFALVKTSNPSSAEFQDVKTDDGRTLYERVGDKVAEWGAELIGVRGYSSVGAVVGATWPRQGAELRARLPRTFFLVPGYGAQGATAADLAGCFDANGGGAAVNASRSILTAYKKDAKYGEDFAAAARDEAIRMRDDLNKAVKGR